MVEILYKSRNAVVIYKPHGIPAQSDPSGSVDAMTLTSHILAEAGEDPSLWLIHRLDRPVAGLMIFARNKKSAAYLSELVKERQITKEYLAVVGGAPASGELNDYIYKDSRTSKAYIVKTPRAGVKDASLICDTVATVTDGQGQRSLVSITLNTGRFHQIRAQLSSRGHSIFGDKKYGSRDTLASGIALAAYHLELDLAGEQISVTHLPNIKLHPWSLFTAADYERVIEK